MNEYIIKAGDWVRVKPHTQYGDLRQGAVQSVMHEHQHNGYQRVRVEAIFDDGGVEVDVGGEMVDVVPLDSLEKIETRYINIDERYGGAEKATVEDYQALDPAVEFKADGEYIYRRREDDEFETGWSRGPWQIVALREDEADNA